MGSRAAAMVLVVARAGVARVESREEAVGAAAEVRTAAAGSVVAGSVVVAGPEVVVVLLELSTPSGPLPQ